MTGDMIVSSVGGANPVLLLTFAAGDKLRRPVYATPVVDVSTGDAMVYIDGPNGAQITMDVCGALVLSTRLLDAVGTLLHPTQSLVLVPGGQS